MDEIRIGLAGLGHRGLHWLKILQALPGYRMTAICDPIVALHERALSSLADRRNVAAYDRYRDMLSDSGVDAVALCVRC